MKNHIILSVACSLFLAWQISFAGDSTAVQAPGIPGISALHPVIPMTHGAITTVPQIMNEQYEINTTQNTDPTSINYDPYGGGPLPNCSVITGTPPCLFNSPLSTTCPDACYATRNVTLDTNGVMVASQDATCPSAFVAVSSSYNSAAKALKQTSPTSNTVSWTDYSATPNVYVTGPNYTCYWYGGYGGLHQVGPSTTSDTYPGALYGTVGPASNYDGTCPSNPYGCNATAQIIGAQMHCTSGGGWTALNINTALTANQGMHNFQNSCIFSVQMSYLYNLYYCTPTNQLGYINASGGGQIYTPQSVVCARVKSDWQQAQ